MSLFAVSHTMFTCTNFVQTVWSKCSSNSTVYGSGKMMEALNYIYHNKHMATYYFHERSSDIFMKEVQKFRK